MSFFAITINFVLVYKDSQIYTNCQPFPIKIC
nr:MAG TPA: hypothetical protein [Caudoviricetes sp.]